MNKLLLLLTFFTISSNVVAQKGWNQKFNSKNHFYMYWGYNVSGYTKSDISFRGDGYDFKLSDVKAYDRPTPFDWNTYFSSNSITIPQYNLRFGFFIGNRWSISGGVDHMKYVVQQNQNVAINGEIQIDGGEFNGSYNGEEITLTEDFLQFEHTDGLNYGSVELEYYGNLYQFNPKNKINYYVGPGVGLLVPRSNVTLMGFPRHDDFHIAGYGLSAKAGLQCVFFKYLTFNFEWKNGFIHMPDILTTGKGVPDKASQHFWFSEITGTIGFTLDFSKKNKE